ncbi:MAG: hypothetical protein JXA24_00680 [Proteobacteria bacterium]|nr:hypothetical protein [Pseudomonadota bacterium]
MPAINSHLVPYCPALPFLGGRAHPVSQRELAPQAVELLRENQALVVSGSSRMCWEANRRIGKTTAVKGRLIPRLRRQGQAVSYSNLQKAVEYRDMTGFRQYDFAPLERRAKTLPEADVYIIDEVQHAIPFKDKIRLYELRRLPYEDAMTALWERLTTELERGAQMVLITCCHPRDPIFEGSMLSSAMALFFTSPVLELWAF